MPRDRKLDSQMVNSETRLLKSTSGSNYERLRDAATLIASVVETLDRSTHICTQCHSTRRQNWVEYQAYAMLKHLPAKLHDQASRLSDQESDRRLISVNL